MQIVKKYETQITSFKTEFETELYELINRTKYILPPDGSFPSSIAVLENNKQSEIWINDVEIFFNNFLKDHPLAEQMKKIFSIRNLRAYSDLIAILESISRDKKYIEQKRKNKYYFSNKEEVQKREFDVFISHANKDKEDLVDKLYQSLNMLGVKIFYDKESLEWGDNWKDSILNGTKKAEFAIIVISKNFFDREWTEKELVEFLNRQNQNGQKLILPVLHEISVDQLKKKYPSIASIHAISSKDYNCDQIALLFARQLIKRLKQI